MEQKANHKFFVFKSILVFNHSPYSPDWHHMIIFCSQN